MAKTKTVPGSVEVVEAQAPSMTFNDCVVSATRLVTKLKKHYISVDISIVDTAAGGTSLEVRSSACVPLIGYEIDAVVADTDDGWEFSAIISELESLMRAQELKVATMAQAEVALSGLSMDQLLVLREASRWLTLEAFVTNELNRRRRT